MKKLFYILLILEIILSIFTINVFLKTYSDINHLIGINIIFFLYFLVISLCTIVVNHIFKKADFSQSKNFRKELKTTFANAFVSSSIVSILLACIIYGFLTNILKSFGLKTGIIHYCSFVAKIWFISSPFLGLEIATFKYFSTIEHFQKPIKLLAIKLFAFFVFSFLFYNSRKNNCFVYAKPLCDILFLFYYSKICFDITLNKT